MKTLLDASARLFSDFQSKLEADIGELLPNSFPSLISLIGYCKENGVDANNRLRAHCDIMAWYEDVDGYDALVMGDQNCTFLVIQTDKVTIKAYKLNHFYDVKDMVPPLNDFKTIVAPYLREDDRKWAALIDAMENNNITGNVSAGNKERCSIEPLFSLTYVIDKDEEDGVYKHALLRAGFDLITGIKDLNSFENQIAQLTFELEESEH